MIEKLSIKHNAEMQWTALCAKDEGVLGIELIPGAALSCILPQNLKKNVYFHWLGKKTPLI